MTKFKNKQIVLRLLVQQYKSLPVCVSALTSSVPHKMEKPQTALAKDFQHPAGIESMLPDSLLLALTTKPSVHINQLKNSRHDLSCQTCLVTLNQLFACRLVILGLHNWQVERQGHIPTLVKVPLLVLKIKGLGKKN